MAKRGSGQHQRTRSPAGRGGFHAAIFLAITLVVLALVLDNTLYNGRYTQAFSQMITDIENHFY
jgi:hypothetical protein